MNKIHIVSFQNPFPANYGGVIDVYYKIKALKNAGYYIILHTYCYGRDKSENDLKNVADEVYYYTRKTGIISQLSFIPYIVNSRRDNKLLTDLLKDNYPILFEGLHTCFLLNEKQLNNRVKMVRMHNIEHEYYKNLSLSTKSVFKKIFYEIESFRLKRYERILQYASIIFPISVKEEKYFRQRYNDVEIKLLSCFFDDKFVSEDRCSENYILYHGNLEVDENIRAVEYILDNIVSKIPNKKFVFAGANPSELLVKKIKSYDNTEIYSNLNNVRLDELIKKAKINLLITFQDTGVKLKLINALYKGGFCVVNDKMISGTNLADECIVAKTDSEMIDLLLKYSDMTYTENDLNKRKVFLENNISVKNTVKIISHILVVK